MALTNKKRKKIDRKFATIEEQLDAQEWKISELKSEKSIRYLRDAAIFLVVMLVCFFWDPIAKHFFIVHKAGINAWQWIGILLSGLGMAYSVRKI